MEGLEQFFKGKDLGYARDPRTMAYAKLKKNTQGMDREQLEAFINANLMIPHSQYKMALGNLIQFLKKQDQMSKLNEVQQFKKIAGLINENWHPDDPAGVDLDDREEDPDDYDDISEDDYSEDPSSDMDDESQSGDTSAMNINEEGESITIDIPENTDYKELARAVAKVLIDDYGAHNYKPFLQALISELK